VLSTSQAPENLSRAEASINELLTSIDHSEDHVRSVFIVGSVYLTVPAQAKAEHQELRWWMLEVLKRRKATDEVLLDGRSYIVTWSRRASPFSSRRNDSV